MKPVYWMVGSSVLVAVIMAFALYPPFPSVVENRIPDELAMPPATSFRIVMGIGDREPTVWDGRIQVSGGKISGVQGWRFAGNDTTDSGSSWKLSSRRGLLPAGAQALKKGKAEGPMQDNGVIVAAELASPDSSLAIETAQGSFSFKASEIPYGESKSFLQGKVEVDRVPTVAQLTTSVDEQDHPALAQTNDNMYLVYVEFVHGDRAQASRQIKEEPKSFDFLSRPVGGDQVFLMRFDKAKRAWSAPMPVSDPKGDIMRAAVAVDRQKRVWVIWSANRNGNFDLYAKNLSANRWSPEMRLTTDPGTDLNPVGATDAKGRVWIAWQGFRNNNLEILAAVQDESKFSRETVVSFSPASDWDPAIATAANGEVAVSWDTYDKGDYDVYFRRLGWQGAPSPGIRMEPPIPVAASQNFEARSSIAYDPQNRLWVAYETADVRWGKDFGAYEKSGVALYQGHNLAVKCFQGSNTFVTAGSLADALPGLPSAQTLAARRRKLQQAAASETGASKQVQAAGRLPGQARQAEPKPLNSFPRLTVDANGTVYVAYRSVAGTGRTPVGTPWIENVSYYDGTKWQGPILVTQTDGLLDSRPSLLTMAPGQILMAATTDHRQSPVARAGPRGGDAVNTDIIAAELRLEGAAPSIQLSPGAGEKPAAKEPDVQSELDQVAAMRAYRVKVGGQQLQMLRGEFHRHTEISGDGGRDGPVIDAYRYMIDAAYMDWGGCCDHDNGGGREYYWWIEQKLTDAYRLGQQYVPMFSYERSVQYPEGHRNVVFAQRGIRPLPRLPKVADDAQPGPAPDTQMLYRYLRQFKGVAASHTSGTNMGTDWRDNDPIVEPVVEIYQGDRQNYEMPGAPRSNSEGDSIGGWRPLGFVSLALLKGYKLGFQSSSDHISTHMSYCNLWVTGRSREAIMEAFSKRRVYGATDNILADVRSGEHFMGEEFTTAEPASISVKLRGMQPFAKVHIIKDNNYVYTTEPGKKEVEFVWKDTAVQKGKTSYYYVRGEQTDSELVWVSPMWITYR